MAVARYRQTAASGRASSMAVVAVHSSNRQQQAHSCDDESWRWALGRQRRHVAAVELLDDIVVVAACAAAAFVDDRAAGRCRCARAWPTWDSSTASRRRRSSSCLFARCWRQQQQRSAAASAGSCLLLHPQP